MNKKGDDMVTPIRSLLIDARKMLVDVQKPSLTVSEARQLFGVTMEKWIVALEKMLANLDDGSTPLAAALSGADIAANVLELGLHDLTQLAAALRPGATFIVYNSALLSPIEQASIFSAAAGDVRFR